MKLHVEYKNDLHSNYMIIEENEGKKNSSYGLNMLMNNHIPGLLTLEVRVIDNISSYYYDITSKHPIGWLYDKKDFSKVDICNIMTKIIKIIETSKEYLLDENNFIIDQNYVFLNLSNSELILCYLPGFRKDIRVQLSAFIEFLMTKVDHKEEGAALLIYSLYKISKEEGYTFLQLLTRLNEEDNNHLVDQHHSYDSKKQEEKENSFILRNMERNDSHPNNKKDSVISEEEIKKYSVNTILYCFVSVVITCILFALLAKKGLVYEKSTNGIDYTKAFALLLVIGGIEAYILNFLLKDKRKVVKIQKKVEFIRHTEEEVTHNNFYKERTEAKEEDSMEQTVVLADRSFTKNLKLIPLDKVKYQDILLTDFPFFIGALKRKVDYSIENQAVSRFHAKLEKISEQFYITDLNSTNGTYVNQERLSINEKKLIQINDEIAFADVKYRFTLS